MSSKAFSQKRGFKPGDKRYILVLLLSAIVVGIAAPKGLDLSLIIALHQTAYGLVLIGGFSLGLGIGTHDSVVSRHLSAVSHYANSQITASSVLISPNVLTCSKSGCKSTIL